MPSDLEFTVGWVCVLRKELDAAKDMLDEYFDDQFDKQLYSLGRISNYGVVITCFPMGDKGNSMAAVVAERMMSKFPNIKVGLMVGIGGGLPCEENDIRLGDVVVGTPAKTHPGVVQFDMGKYTTDGFERTGYLNAPPEELRAVLQTRMPPHNSQLTSRLLKRYPGKEFDQLYDAGYKHVKRERSCEQCDKQHLVARAVDNRADGPYVFYGTIASGNAVIKDATKRNTLIQEHGVLCCEMEAAGLMKTTFPCLVIRGISDYADSHKNDIWQDYAAAAAARYAKDFLCEIPPGIVGRLEPINDDNRNVYWCVPHPNKTLFTGRTTVLRRVEDAVRPSHKRSDKDLQRRFVIVGLGGQGKSEICLQVANSVRKSFWGVFWVDVSSDSSAKAGFLGITRELRSHVKDIASVCQLLSNVKDDWLLILDNADDPRFDYKAYLPSGNHGAVIMTSRNPECKAYNTVGFEELGALEEKDCLTLLLTSSGIPRELWSNFDEAAKEVIKSLEKHTLALVQAGAYIAKGYCTLDEYTGVFEMHRKRLLEFQTFQEQSRYNSVYSTFEASAKRLESHHDALDLLNVLSVLHYADTPIKLFEDAWTGCRKIYEKNEEEQREIGTLSNWHASLLPKFIQCQFDKWEPFRLIDAMNLLISLALVNKNQETDTISMHSLTHAWINERHSLNQKGQFWEKTAAILAFSCYGQPSLRPYYSQIKPHLTSFFDKISMESSRPSRPIIQVLFQCGWLLHHSHDDYKLCDLLQRVFCWLQADQNSPTIDHFPLYDLLSRNLNRLGEHKAVIELLRKMNGIQGAIRAQTSLDHHRLAVEHELASAYLGSGRVTEAVGLLEHIVYVERTLPNNHPDRLASEHELGSAYLDNGQVEKAVELLEQVVDIQRSLQEDHPQRLGSEHELGSAYLEDGQVEKAVGLLEHVVDIQRSLQEDHPDRLASEHELGRAYRKGKRSREAVDILRHVVDTQRSLAKDHPARLASERELDYALKDRAGRKLLESQDGGASSKSTFRLSKQQYWKGLIRECESNSELVSLLSGRKGKPNPARETCARADGNSFDDSNPDALQNSIPQPPTSAATNLKPAEPGQKNDLKPTSTFQTQDTQGPWCAKSDIFRIYDTRFKFQHESLFPIPREFIGGIKKYRLGLGSSVPLDLGTFEQQQVSWAKERKLGNDY